MLNHDTLAQLQGLRSQMEADKEHANAIVKGTQARYGFAVLEDGREIFIPPDEMLKVFPNDKVRVCVRPSKDGKTVAEIEKLLDSPLGDFTGRCVRKGKALFVQPDLPQLSRWLFIPPHARNGVNENDYVRAAVLRHPVRDGKPQAKVLSIVGNSDTPGIENLYCQAKHRLEPQWPKQQLEALEKHLVSCNPLETTQRRDLSDLEFVSIDAAKTQDIDDALYAEISSDGWTLYVAIADPTAYIEGGSELQQYIASRATSVYFHGDVLPMLPEVLSQETCALSEGADRPALVCKISVSDAGEVGNFEFIEAKVRSRAKLSYYGVDRYLAGNYDELMSHATPLEALYQVYRALRENRNNNGLVMEDRTEYRWILNDQKKIGSIETYEKMQSQKLVEECMIAANRCAARFLTDCGSTGPFVSHPGFRADRLDETKKFLAMHVPTLAEKDPTDREGYRDIMKGLSGADSALPLRAMVNRLLTRATLSTQPCVHMGMALECYTNVTSPLRKYSDFLAHQQIKTALRGNKAELVNKSMLDQLSKALTQVRAATLEAERWLASSYLLAKSKATGGPLEATICHINSSGFNARLNDCGLEGFVDLRKDPEKFSFDKWQSSLTSTTRRFALNDPVQLEFVSVDDETHQVLFKLLPDSGLKPAKNEVPESA